MCLQGASAFEKLLEEQREGKIRVFVIWEPVLPTDLAAPSTMTLKRISDARASQYWDKEHLVSKQIGETDGVVWDYVAVYPRGKLWDKSPPEPLYSHAPVIYGIDGAREAMLKLLLSRAALYKKSCPMISQPAIAGVTVKPGAPAPGEDRVFGDEPAIAGESLQTVVLSPFHGL